MFTPYDKPVRPYFHFIEGNFEAQVIKVTCPKSQSWKIADLGFKPLGPWAPTPGSSLGPTVKFARATLWAEGLTTHSAQDKRPQWMDWLFLKSNAQNQISLSSRWGFAHRISTRVSCKWDFLSQLIGVRQTGPVMKTPASLTNAFFFSGWNNPNF